MGDRRSFVKNTVTGEIFETTISLLLQDHSKQIKRKEWTFDWQAELRQKDRQVYKVTTLDNPTIIQGLISLTDKGDHIFMNLIETAPFNRGEKKLYTGVAGSLVAFACKVSFDRYYDGIVSFVAKTQLIEHYKKTLGARLFAGNRMFIDTRDAAALVRTFLKEADRPW
jgi:hypothetical protein